MITEKWVSSFKGFGFPYDCKTLRTRNNKARLGRISWFPCPNHRQMSTLTVFCYVFPSSSQQLQDLKIQALSTKRVMKKAIHVIHPALPSYEAMPGATGQHYILLYRDCEPTLMWEEAAVYLGDVVCMSSPAPYLQLAVFPVPALQPHGIWKLWTDNISSLVPDFTMEHVVIISLLPLRRHLNLISIDYDEYKQLFIKVMSQLLHSLETTTTSHKQKRSMLRSFSGRSSCQHLESRLSSSASTSTTNYIGGAGLLAVKCFIHIDVIGRGEAKLLSFTTRIRHNGAAEETQLSLREAWAVCMLLLALLSQAECVRMVRKQDFSGRSWMTAPTGMSPHISTVW